MIESGSKRVFLSYARQQQREAEEVAVKLRASRHNVFFDKKSLNGGRFDAKIRSEVNRCDLFVVFISAASTRNGSYVLTELGYAEQRWPDPSKHVLAVRVDEVAIEAVPAYLRATITLQAIDGNFATGVCNLITERLAHDEPSVTSSIPPDKLSVAECSDQLSTALSRRRKLPPTGTATVETVHAIDALAASIRSRFKPDDGSVIAGARLVKVIGMGNFGTVWEALEVETQRRVAVKIFRLERLTEGQMLFRFRKSIRAMRLLSEDKRLAKCKDATGAVVAFLQADATELALSMELLNGGNLDEVAKHGWTLTRKLEVMSRVCIAVAYSHANGVIHRDIKPANIVLNDQAQPVLTDFDIADIKFATSMSTTVEGGLGTPVFAAPEQLRDADLANERSDVYSLGRLLYYLLLERSPGYEVEKDPTLANLNRFPPALVEAVRRATQHDPSRRFASVEQMAAALAKCQTGAAAWRALAAQSRRWARHNWAVLVIMALVMGGSGAAVVYQSKVTKRELAIMAKFEELRTAKAKLIGAQEVVAAKLERTEQELVAVIQQAKADRSPELISRLDEVKKRRDEAIAELAKIDQKEKQIEQQKREAQNAFGMLDKSVAVSWKPQSPVSATVSSKEAQFLGSPMVNTKEADKTFSLTDYDCRNSERCAEFGVCTARGGKCIAGSVADCTKSKNCRQHGYCTADDWCIAASDSDCARSEDCRQYGQCTARDGKCIATSVADCTRSEDCRQYGQCTARDGKCIATSDNDCTRIGVCSKFGRCAARDSKCIATSDADCTRSEGYWQYGQCVARNGNCIATSAADCTRIGVCSKFGRCAIRDGKCIATSDAECTRSEGCWQYGQCVARDGKCIATSVADCTRSGACWNFGRCTARDGTCVVAFDADCMMSKKCSQDGLCAASRGECIKFQRPAW